MDGSHEGTVHDNEDAAASDHEEERRNLIVNMNIPYGMDEFHAENLENERISREGFVVRNAANYDPEEQIRSATAQNAENEIISQSNVQTSEPSSSMNMEQDIGMDNVKTYEESDELKRITDEAQSDELKRITDEAQSESPSEASQSCSTNDRKNSGPVAEKQGPTSKKKSKKNPKSDQISAMNLTVDSESKSDDKVTNGSSETKNEDSKSNIEDRTVVSLDVYSENNVSECIKKVNGSLENINEELNKKEENNADNNINGSPVSIKEIETSKSNVDTKNEVNLDVISVNESQESLTNVNGSIDSRSELMDCEPKKEDDNAIDKNNTEGCKNLNGSSENISEAEELASKVAAEVINMNGDAKSHSPIKNSSELLEKVIILSKSELKEAIMPVAKTKEEDSGTCSESDGKRNSSSKNTENPTRTSSRTKSSPKRADDNKDRVPAKREHRKVTFDSPIQSDLKSSAPSSSKRTESSSNASSKTESKDSSSSSSKNEKSKTEIAADSMTKKTDDSSSNHGKGHHSSRRSSRDHHSSHRKHSSHCRSLKDGDAKCDCRKRHHSDRDRHDSHRSDREKTDSRRSNRDKDDKDSHRSSHSSKNSRKHDRLNFKQQVNISELHNHSVKQTKTEPKSGDPAYRLHPRVPWTPHETIAKFKHQELFRVETDANGGATTCHLYYDEISHLPEDVIKEIAEEFIMLSYSEDENEHAHHVMGIVHGGADYLPDLLDYMADHYPTITVKTGSLTGRATQSITMGEYRDEAYRTYSNGTFRYAPLQELSICGVQGEEVGAYFPDFVKRLEKSCHMLPVMPWSYFSVVSTDNPRESNDGPIFWIRPGEQTMPSSDASRQKGRLAKGVSRLSEAREALFEDRTKPHADQIGVDGGSTDTAPTAAVGLLKAINCGRADHGGRATKDVVAFHAEDYNALLDILQIDVYEPPLRQCTMWLETAKLNSLRRQGVRYSRRQLHDGDVYYLPRKVIHQFQTISSVASVAWHVRFLEYFKTTGAPNLHAPTGLNKGAVYYEKTVVPPYHPPKPAEPDEELLLVKSPRKRRRRSEGDGKNEAKKKVKKEKAEDKKKKAATPLKVPVLIIKPIQPNASAVSDAPAPASAEKIPVIPNVSVVEKDLKPSAPVKKDAHVVSPIKLEKSGTNSFCVVHKTTDTAAPKKMLRQNMPFKKRKTEKVEESYDVLGDIMSQMKKSKTD